MSPVLIPKNFSLPDTLDCGQAFRWRQEGDEWIGIAGRRILRIKEEGEQLALDCSQEDFELWWRDYFDLAADYDEIRGYLSGLDSVLAQAADYAPGIRVLRQEPWEALCSFIISQNNNIPRIKGIVERLCALLGDDLGGGHSFPTPEVLAACSLEDLAPLRSGFRAKYLLSAAQLVAGGQVDLQAIWQAPLEQARQELMRIMGVGPKVADCALLYGFHRLECFPMDVWMKRAMAVLFPGKGPEDFAPYGGIAQQYIFHYSRSNPQLFAQEEPPGPKSAAGQKASRGKGERKKRA